MSNELKQTIKISYDSTGTEGNPVYSETDSESESACPEGYHRCNRTQNKYVWCAE